MCVAAVSEIIIEALNTLNDSRAFSQLPLASWTRGNLTSIRANIFQYEGTGSRGVGHALERIGVGREKAFSTLRPYDFVNFNRTNGTGHAAVFLAFLDKHGNPTNRYSNDVIGFHYFSAQGKGKPDAGFADRYAYFTGFCPSERRAIPRDCDVIRSSNIALLSGGELWMPSRWQTQQAVAATRRSVRSALAGTKVLREALSRLNLTLS
jgi:hypothetical protein